MVNSSITSRKVRPDVSKLTRPVSTRIFKPGSSSLTTDFNPIASKVQDYTGDNLVAAKVPMTDGPQTHDTCLNALDSVDEQATRILESEKLTVKTSK